MKENLLKQTKDISQVKKDMSLQIKEVNQVKGQLSIIDAKTNHLNFENFNNFLKDINLLQSDVQDIRSNLEKTNNKLLPLESSYQGKGKSPSAESSYQGSSFDSFLTKMISLDNEVLELKSTIEKEVSKKEFIPQNFKLFHQKMLNLQNKLKHTKLKMKKFEIG